MSFPTVLKRIEQLGQFGQQSTVAVVVIWVVAIIASAGAISALTQAVKTYQDSTALSSLAVPQLHLTETPLAEADYRALAKAIPAVDGIVVRPDSNGILLSANGLHQLYVWRALIDRILFSNTGIRWEAKKLCAGACPDFQGTAYNILLSGNRHQVSIK